MDYQACVQAQSISFLREKKKAQSERKQEVVKEETVERLAQCTVDVYQSNHKWLPLYGSAHSLVEHATRERNLFSWR